MGRLDLPDKLRDADLRSLFPISAASRAINRGDYGEAIAVLVEAGLSQLDAERFVAVTLAINTPSVCEIPLRLAVLVDVALRVMSVEGWSFGDVGAALECAQLEAGGQAA